jgi:hypothetical protein
MSTRMSAEFRSSELLLDLGFAQGGGRIGTSSAVIVMDRLLQIRSKATVMRSPSLDSPTTPSPGAPEAPTEDGANEVSRNLDQQAGLIGYSNAQHQIARARDAGRSRGVTLPVPSLARRVSEGASVALGRSFPASRPIPADSSVRFSGGIRLSDRGEKETGSILRERVPLEHIG